MCLDSRPDFGRHRTVNRRPVQIVRSAPIGGAAAFPLPSSLNIPSLEDIWPYAPRNDNADTFWDPSHSKQVRINYGT